MKECNMDIRLAETIPTKRGPADYFSGTVWVEALVEAPSPARLRAARVTFEPGARTAWHTHPLGQTLYVLSGVGFIQLWGQAAQIIKPGDAVWINPGEKHWHGARPGNAMTHLALQESLDGSVAEWMELVSEEAYADAAGNA
jgi:quercetin dioxygenase-like cupin family protein